MALEVEDRARVVWRCVRRALRREPRMGRPRVPARDHRLGARAVFRDHLMTSVIQKTVSPVDGRVYVERVLATSSEIDETLRIARHAFAAWRNVTLDERLTILTRFCDEFEKRGAKIAEELT